MSDEKIEEANFVFGVNVVDIGDVRVSRGLTRRHESICSHRQLMYDQIERRVWCKDCESDVDSFDAFSIIVEYLSAANKRIEVAREEVNKAKNYNLRRIAARKLDKIWMTNSLLPCCPHCDKALTPSDFTNEHISTVSSQLALARRKKQLNKDK